VSFDFTPPLAGSDVCPRITAGLPGLGGFVSFEPDHFFVDEIPAYPPSGDGTHQFVHIRKRGLTTQQAKRLLAEAAGVQPKDVGVAGRKDKHAVTTQWLSLPCAPVDPEQDGLEILEAIPHGQKLRMGHLRGNRFRLFLQGMHPEAQSRWPAIHAALQAGMPNYFGVQRFGKYGLKDGVALIANPRKRVRDPRFVAGIVQSAAFNRWLGARVAADQLHSALPGDVLKKRATGGLFESEDAEVDALRVASGECDPTGPLPGPKCRGGGGTEYYGLDDPQRMTVLAKFAPGTRRVARIVPGDLAVDWADDNCAWVSFSLPKGAFATVVLGEITHTAPGEARRHLR
jgi:tRNA pseudouridine13 synthase